MKILFTDFPLGWDINSEKLESLLMDLWDMGKIDIHFFKSTFSHLSKAAYPSIIRCEPASITNCNHVEISLDEKVIAKFF